MKRNARSDVDYQSPKRAKKSAAFVALASSKQQNLLDISAMEWEQAERYFSELTSNEHASCKMDKKLHNTKHSFIKFDDQIIALANKKLEGTLGEGSFGKVVLGQSRTGDNCAVKIEAGKAREDDAPEVLAMRRLKYYKGEIARVLPEEKQGLLTCSKRYTALALRKGKELKKIIDELSYVQKLLVAIRVCEALLAIHYQRVIHADVKASNIVVDINQNEISVDFVDFDFSLLLPDYREHTYDFYKGTQGYIAPEIREYKTFSFSSDIYALGMMFKDDIHLPEALYTQMILDDPKTRCSLKDTILRLLDELARQPESDGSFSKLILETKSKYETKVSLLSGFTSYMQQTMGIFNRVISASSPQDYLGYIFRKHCHKLK